MDARSYELERQYGPLSPGFKFTLKDGYWVLVGENDVGKSSILQFLFRNTLNTSGPGSLCYIPADRDYIETTTESQGRALEDYNQELFAGALNSTILSSASEQNPYRRELPRLLLTHTHFSKQLLTVNRYLERLGIPELILGARQTPTFERIALQLHGTGLRSLFYILAALTDESLQVILIDEPERSLEPRLQKRVRDLLIEESKHRAIVVATHSHLFLNTNLKENNLIVERLDETTSITPVGTDAGLMDIAYRLLGNSMTDLYFPANYLIVEGSSDQIICEKVSELLGIQGLDLQILAATGANKISNLVAGIESTLRPLIARNAPYKNRVVVLFDNPSEELKKIVRDVKAVLGQKRCFILKENSMEEYLAGELYSRAGLNKEKILTELAAVKDDYNKSSQMKRFITTKIAAILTPDDLSSLREISKAIAYAQVLGEQNSN